MKRIAKFEKVSKEQFIKDFKKCFSDTEENVIEDIYNGIKLPERKTKDSAGYDFHTPIGFTIKPGESIKIPTGIRAKIDEGWVLKCYPRSGLGFKFRETLANTVGVIDGDYYYSDNEGHIFAKVVCCSENGLNLSVKCGDGFMQGIFVEYGITVDDKADGIRNGGFGSTTNK